MFGLVEETLAARFAEQLGELVRGVGRLQLVLGLHLHHAQQAVGGVVEQPDERVRQLHPGDVHRHQPQREPFGLGDRQVLRHHLADQDVRHGDERERERERDGMQERLRQPDHVEQAGKPVRDRGFAEPAEQQRADGDAELCARQHLRHVPAGVDHDLRAGLSLFQQRFQPVAAGGDEGELRADEEGVHQQQRDDQEDVQPVVHGLTSPAGATSTSAIRCRSISVTVSRQSSTTTASPSSGIRPSRSRISPAMVS